MTEVTSAAHSFHVLRGRSARGTIDPVHKAVLDIIDPGWDDGRTRRGLRLGIRALSRYVARERHTDIPTDHIEDGYRLGYFAGAARARRRDQVSSALEIQELEQVNGWHWTRDDARWARGTGHLRAWVRVHGTMPEPGAVHGAFPLGAWVTECADLHQRGALRADRARVWRALTSAEKNF